MNREIKFRTFNPVEKSFVYFNLDHCMTTRSLTQTKYPVQQFTGMKDKMGHEVYEGDIVCENMTEETAALGGESLLGEVYFAAGTFMIDGDGPLFDHTFSTSPDILEDFTVVGNVFENPELLKHYE